MSVIPITEQLDPVALAAQLDRQNPPAVSVRWYGDSGEAEADGVDDARLRAAVAAYQPPPAPVDRLDVLAERLGAASTVAQLRAALLDDVNARRGRPA